MRAENIDTKKIIDILKGTKTDLHSAVEIAYPNMDADDLTEREHEEIDAEIFCCEICEKWFEYSQIAETPESGQTIEIFCINCDQQTENNDENDIYNLNPFSLN